MDKRMRTWAEIDLDRLEHNYRTMAARLAPRTRFLAVVKANAYGHGAVRVARLMEELGCGCLAVACIQEAVELRQAGITLPILILGYTDPDCAGDLIRYDITQAVTGLEMAEALSNSAAGLGKVKAHLKLDTGMGRLGFPVQDGADSFDRIARAMAQENLAFEGVFTHFAVSDVEGPEAEAYTRMQYEAFIAAVERIERAWGARFAIKHCTNSGAMVSYKETYLDLVRPGIALYGCYPDKPTPELDLQPVMSLKARVAQVKPFRPGQSVSYGRTYTTGAPRRVAVITIGYADGLHRVLSNHMQVLIRGRRCDQIGRICMDMCMVDVTDLPEVRPGDEVTVFGTDGDQTIFVEEPAVNAGTISYELLCAVAPRVPRVYLRQGQPEP